MTMLERDYPGAKWFALHMADGHIWQARGLLADPWSREQGGHLINGRHPRNIETALAHTLTACRWLETAARHAS